jgi:nicotinamidase-related amidase
MVKDNFNTKKNRPITPLAVRIIAPINRLIAAFRNFQWPVVFSTDAYHATDFIFTSHMKPHSLAGTEGAEIIEELDFRHEDLWLPKPRFSAFFQTSLDERLRKKGVTLCAVAGIATNYCVLTTVLDAICHDFKAFLLEDCTAATTETIHEQTLSIYRRSPLYPLLKVGTSNDLLEETGVSERD